jgi:hypothetical protein
MSGVPERHSKRGGGGLRSPRVGVTMCNGGRPGVGSPGECGLWSTSVEDRRVVSVWRDWAWSRLRR